MEKHRYQTISGRARIWLGIKLCFVFSSGKLGKNEGSTKSSHNETQMHDILLLVFISSSAKTLMSHPCGTIVQACRCFSTPLLH